MRRLAAKQHEIAIAVKPIPVLSELYLKSLFMLFVEKSSVMQQKPVDSASYQSGQLELVRLLQSITELISGLPPSFEWSAEQVALLRSVWCYSILLGTDDNNLWKPNWRETIAVLAKLTPLLVRNEAFRFIDVDIESNSLIISTPDAHYVRTFFLFLLAC
jgi:hypothetical protein